MHSLSKEILEKYQVRQRKKQKTEFIEWLKPQLEKEGYAVNVEVANTIGGSRNIVVGNPETAKYIFAGHYDTCAAMPFPNFLTPKNIFMFMLYQLVLVVVLLVPSAAAWLAILCFTQNIFLAQLGLIAVLVFFTYMLIAGVPNKHTANDNTSGVITLIESAISMPKNLRDNVAYIFFDNEEKGLLGSSAYYAAHKKMMRDKVLINFDCVSDGDEIYVVPKGLAKKDLQLQDMLAGAFLPKEGKKVIVDKGFFIYPSDQASFKKGVAVCSMKRMKLLGLYISRIHTPRDTVMDEANIELIREAMQRIAAAR
jgi:Predicted aminopeptidases